MLLRLTAHTISIIILLLLSIDHSYFHSLLFLRLCLLLFFYLFIILLLFRLGFLLDVFLFMINLLVLFWDLDIRFALCSGRWRRRGGWLLHAVDLKHLWLDKQHGDLLSVEFGLLHLPLFVVVLGCCCIVGYELLHKLLSGLTFLDFEL